MLKIISERLTTTNRTVPVLVVSNSLYQGRHRLAQVKVQAKLARTWTLTLLGQRQPRLSSILLTGHYLPKGQLYLMSSILNKIKQSSIYNLGENEPRSKRRRKLSGKYSVNVTSSKTGHVVKMRTYKARKGCSKVRQVCIKCLTNSAISPEIKICETCLDNQVIKSNR